MAYIATSRHEDALDIVQDSMFTLAKNYSKKPENEWPGLFHRILQNKIRDNYRRSNVLKKIFFWQNRQRLDEDEYNLESVDEHQPSPERIMYSHSLGDEIDKALNNYL